MRQCQVGFSFVGYFVYNTIPLELYMKPPIFSKLFVVNRKRAVVCIVLSASMGALSLPAATFFWDDGSSGNHDWSSSGNWNGASGYPNGSGDDAYLISKDTTYDNEAGGGKGVNGGDMSVTLDSTFSVGELVVVADDAAHDWVLNSGRIQIVDALKYDRISGGSLNINSNLEFVDNDARIYVEQGGVVELNGELIGSETCVLRLDGNYNRPGLAQSVYLGEVSLNAANNDSFLGTIEIGTQLLEVTQVNGLRMATVEIGKTNGLSFIDGAVVGAISGTYDQVVSGNLYVGYDGSNKSASYSGDLSGSGSIHKEGSGVWTLTGEGTHAGTFYIGGGRIRLGAASGANRALQDSGLFLWTGTDDSVNFNGADAVIGALSGGGNLFIGPNTLLIDGKNSGSFAGNHFGVISGAGTIEINTLGTQELGYGNTYSGGTHLYGGTLICDASGDLGNTGGALTIGNAVFQAKESHTQSRALNFETDSTIAEFSIDTNKTLIWSGSVNANEGTQTIRKAGAGMMVFANDSNGYTGLLYVDAGKVQLTSTSMEHAKVDLSVDDGLVLQDANVVVGSLQGSGDLELIGGEIFTVGGNDQSTSYSGILSGAGNFTKSGTGTWTLSGRSTLTDGIDLSAGDLHIDGDVDTVTFSGVSSVAGSTLKGTGKSSGALVLSGDVSPGDEAASVGTIHAASIELSGTYECDVTLASSDLLKADGNFDASEANLELAFGSGAPSESAYVLATYGSRSGKFGTVTGMPSGYRLDYAYDGNQIALIQDSIAPTVVSVTPVSVSPTNANSIEFTVVFDEGVQGFDAFSDLVVGSSGTVAATGASFSSLDDITYAVTLTGVAGNGGLTLAVKTDSTEVEDFAGVSLASSVTSSAVVIDNVQPWMTSFTADASGLTSADTIVYNLKFSEPVVGLVNGSDIYITWRTEATADPDYIAVVNSGDDINYTVTVNNISGDGRFEIRGRYIEVGDAAGNQLFEHPSTYSPYIVIDNTAPTVTSVTPVTVSPTDATSVSYEVVLNEVVVGFDSFADLSVGATGTASASGATFTSSDDVTFTVTLTGVTGDGDLALNVVTGEGVQDLVGFDLASGVASSAVRIDNSAPSVESVTALTNSPTTASSVSFEVVFDEAVAGFDSFADLSVGTTDTVAASAATFATSDSITYTVTLTDVTGDGDLTLSVETSASVADAAGHTLEVGATSSVVTIDNSAPSVFSVIPITSSPTAATNVSFEVVFGEAVQGFDDFTDLSVASTDSATVTAATFSTNDNITYTVTLTDVSGDGTLTLGVVTGAGVTDPAENTLESSVTSSAVTIDQSAPSVVSVTPITSSPTTAASVSFEVVFDESVESFDSLADLSIGKTDTVNVTGATFSTVDNITFTVTLTDVSGDGDLTLSVVTGANVTDPAGQALSTSPISSVVTVDNALPTVTSITAVTASPTNTTDVSFTVVFSEAVSGFDSYADLSVGTTDSLSATFATFSTVDDITYTVTMTGTSGDGELTLGVVTGSGVQDVVAHDLSSSVTSVAVVLDHTAPVISLVGGSSIELKRGGAWTDPGYSAVDAVDDSVSVTVGGDSVDSATLGDYSITYNAVDAAGNAAEQKTRTVSVVNAAPLYVNVAIQGEAPEDGLSWGSAYAHLQDALSATQPGVLQPIYIAKGIYYPDVSMSGNSNDRDAVFLIPSGVQLYGGFSGSSGEELEDRDLSENVTVLSGDVDQNDSGTDVSGVLTGAPQSSINGGNSRNLVVFEGASGDRVLDGVILSAAHADGSSVYGGGAAIRIEGGSVTLVDCQLTGNWNTYNSWNESFKGAGLAVSDGTVALDGCTISNNYATSDYAGLIQNGGDVTFSNGWIESNQAVNGAGVTALHGSLLIENSFIRAQQAVQSGAGVLIGSGFVTLHNSVISGNAAGQNGGGIWIELPAASLTTINVTIAGNQAGLEGGGLQSTECYNVNLSNTIVSQNSAFVGSTDNIGLTYGEINAYTSLLTGVALTVPGGSGGSTGGSSGGSGGGAPGRIYNHGGCFSSNTEFATAEPGSNAPTLAGEYSLVRNSFGIDLGSNFAGWDADSTDLGGGCRIVDGDFSGSASIDMGAYEYQGFALQAWRRQYGLDVYGADDHDVLAGDGLTALMKYAFNMGDPYVTTTRSLDLNTPEAGGQPVLSEVDEILTFSYIQPVSEDNRGDVSVFPVASTTMGADSWEYWRSFNDLLYEETIEVLEGGVYQLHQIKIDLSKGDRVFFRCYVGDDV